MYKKRTFNKINIVKKVKQNDFFKNVTVLAGGTTIAKLLAILATPFLARLFLPEDFALLAAFTSVASLFGIVATGKYELAIILPQNNREAQVLLIGILYLAGAFSLLSPFILFVFSKFNTACSLILSNGLLIYFVIFIFCLSALDAFRYFFIRTKQFKAISFRVLLVSFFTISFNLLGGCLFYNNKIFIISTTLAQIIALFLFLYLYFRTNGILRITLKDVSNVFVKYKKFPQMIVPGRFLNELTGNLPILFLPSLYSQNEIGQFAFVQKIISLPIGVIGRSVQQVFLQKISKASDINQKKLLLKGSFLLLLFIAVFAIPCVVFARPLFRILFGEEWLFAAELAQILTPMYILQFVVTSLTDSIFIVNKKLNMEFYLQIVRFFLVSVSFLLIFFLNVSFSYGIMLFSFAMSFWYALEFFVGLFILNQNIQKTL